MGNTDPSFDSAAAHRFFAADCFNRAWSLLDLPARTPEQDDEMLQLAMASLWHWTRRDDVAPVNRSVGCWQISRIYAVLRQPDNARHYAERSREWAERGDAGPFYLAYAQESLARAEALAGHARQASAHLDEAYRYAKAVTDPEEEAGLSADLTDVERLIAGLERLTDLA